MSEDESGNFVSLIGLFLTLVSLLGTFVYIRLGDWYRETRALEIKWELNIAGDDPEQKAARRACRYEIEQVVSLATLWNSLGVTIFIIFITILSFSLWRTQTTSSTAGGYILAAGSGFLVLYLVMTSSFLVAGYQKARRIRKEIDEEFPLKKKGIQPGKQATGGKV